MQSYNQPAALFDAANRQHAAGRVREAIESYRALLRIAPDVAEVHYNLGTALLQSRRFTEAVESFETVLRKAPEMAECHANIANALLNLRQFAKAEFHCHAAIRYDPALAQARSLLGTVLRELGRPVEALASFELALRLRPGVRDVHNNMGNALKDLGRIEEARMQFQAALQLRPDSQDVRYNLGTLALLAGAYETGWADFELRWQPQMQGARPFDGPIWDGSSTADTVLIYAEQGLGDSIQFCRYVALAAERAPVVFAAPQTLCELFEHIHPDVTVVDLNTVPQTFTHHCPLMSLPFVFGTTLADIPADIPYLRTDSSRVTHWQERCANLTGARVGIVWAGNPDNPNDTKRSLPWSLFSRIVTETSGCTFVSLQKGGVASRRDMPGADGRIVDWTDDLETFADTAALIETLDLVIGVDTAVIHLAGAVGKPAWLLNRYDTCWRWLLDREDTPWYPTVRIFRQPSIGDWSGVLDRLCRALHKFTSSCTSHERQAG